jgi:hypothetical protein
MTQNGAAVTGRLQQKPGEFSSNTFRAFQAVQAAAVSPVPARQRARFFQGFPAPPFDFMPNRNKKRM